MRELTDEQRQKICREARKWLGVPFKMFGFNRRGIGCSSFVVKIYRTIGIYLAPKTDWLFLSLDVIPPEKLRPGDIVFFCRSPRPYRRIATHVAIYIGDGKIINSNQRAGGVREQLLSEVPGLITEKNSEILAEWLKELTMG